MHDTRPGSALKRIIDGKRITVKQAAEQIGISFVMLYNVLNAKSAISPELAVKIEKWCGDWTADSYVILQAQTALAEARKAAEKETA